MEKSEGVPGTEESGLNSASHTDVCEPSSVDPEISLLLGDIPSGNEMIFGKPVLQALADRWEKYLLVGLDKNDKEEIVGKYPVPSNIPSLKSPLLNPELESSVPESSKKADKYLVTLQNHLGTGLTALSEVIDKILLPGSNISDPKKDILPPIVAAGKIICGVFHMISTNRKYQIEGHLNSTVRKVVKESTPSEGYLCGKTFAEKYKEIKNQWRTGREMKKFVVQGQKSSSSFRPQQTEPVATTSKSHGSQDFQRNYVQNFKMKGRQYSSKKKGELQIAPERREKRTFYSNRNYRK